jgi:hypothetical protein
VCVAEEEGQDNQRSAHVVQAPWWSVEISENLNNELFLCHDVAEGTACAEPANLRVRWASSQRLCESSCYTSAAVRSDLVGSDSNGQRTEPWWILDLFMEHKDERFRVFFENHRARKMNVFLEDLYYVSAVPRHHDNRPWMVSYFRFKSPQYDKPLDKRHDRFKV